MVDLDPQVQIQIIKLAVEWAQDRTEGGGSIEAYYDKLAEHFDKFYKVIVKTVAGE